MSTIEDGGKVEVFRELVEHALGEAVVSRREEAWTRLEQARARNEPVPGVIVERVRGGFTVDLGGASALLPGSQIDVRPVRDLAALIGKEQLFAILKMDRPGGHIVVSRRAILEEARLAELQLADRLKLERESHGWSLAELAERSDVSKAMISKIERREASPTAATLVRLAGAFDLTLAALLARAEAPAGPVVRAADQPVWRDPASGYIRRQLFAREDHPLELVAVELPPGARVGFPAASYARIRQVIWVIAGALVIEEGGDRRELASGDCLAFGAPSDSVFANETRAPCTYLVVVARS